MKKIINNSIFTRIYSKIYIDHESQWVLDLDESFADISNDNEEILFNFIWLKKAMFNLILGEKAYELKNINKL